ncbi:hypothetical protein [Bacillus sp. B15-48]|uniref:hypothetical protein n=1 Tax=Bacillus sp. B15-48 TaxID=1548601 RepID=UPI00193F86A1|nr:hypothetical protein [Bacillus sp. B15-48]MBM4761751.1 hypothetical protein [Bacillus sp. B15-48]
MNQYPFSRYLYVFYSFIFLLYIMNVFIGSESLNYLLGILTIITLIISFPLASGLFKILGGAFLAIGSFLFFTTGQPLLNVPQLLTSNLSLLALLAMLPWMNTVVQSGRFDRSLNQLIKVNVSDLGKLYPRSSIITHTLAAFLNLPAATISQEVLKTNLSSLSKELRNSFINTSTLRGYSLALAWSPLEITLAVAIFTTGVDYVSILPWVLLITVITILLDSLWGRFHYQKYSYGNTDEDNKQKLNVKELTKKIAHLVLSLALFLTLVILFGNLFQLGFTLTVTLLIFPFAFVWSMIMKRSRRFWVIGWNTWKTKTNTMQNFIVLFISLSLFSNSLNQSSFLDIIQKPLLLVSDYSFILLFFIQAIFVILSLFGIHPVATIGILTGIITPLLEIMNPVSIAIVLITGSVATFTVGTYGLLVTLTSINLEQSPYRITLKNMPFALFTGLIGTLVAYLIL